MQFKLFFIGIITISIILIPLTTSQKTNLGLILNISKNITNNYYGGGGSGESKWIDAGNYIYPNNTFANNVEVRGYINATDWSNVTLYESQILDLLHTVNTDTWNTTEQMQDAMGASFNNTLVYDDANDASGVNMTLMNATMDDRDNDTTYTDLANFTDVGNIYQEDITPNACGVGDFMIEIRDNGELSCATPTAVTQEIVQDWVGAAFVFPLIYDDPVNEMYLNMTFINETIDDRDTVGAGNTTEEMQDAVGSAFNESLDYNDAQNSMGVSESWVNGTIDNRTASTTYLPYNFSVDSGTIDDGNLTSLLFLKDGDSLNISEASGANPLTIIINFTEVENFNNIILRLQYIGGVGHEIEVGLWDTTTLDYEEEYGEITDMEEFAISVINVIDSTDHISSGNVSLRLRHVQNGIPSHDLYIDYASLLEGFSTITNSEHDSLLDRDNKANHPWALPVDGSRTMTGQLTVNDTIQTGGEGKDGNFSIYSEQGATDYAMDFITHTTMMENTRYKWPASAPDSPYVGTPVLAISGNVGDVYTLIWSSIPAPVSYNIFGTFNPDSGNSPVADSPTDTLIITTKNGTINTRGNSVTDTLFFDVNNDADFGWRGEHNFSEDLLLLSTLTSNNECGIPSAIFSYERTAPASNQALAMGNGDVLQGAPQLCAGNVTGIVGSCENCATPVTEIAMELRINGVSQTCDTPQLISAYDTDGVECAVTFSQFDRVGCYTKTETGLVTGLTCTIYVRYD